MTTNNADGWCGVRHIPTDEVVATFKYAAHASLWGDGSYKGRYELVPIPAPGSVRRARETVGDLEFTAPAQPLGGKASLFEAPANDDLHDAIKATIDKGHGVAGRGLRPHFLAASLTMKMRGEEGTITVPVQVFRYTPANRGWVEIMRTGPDEFGRLFLHEWKQRWGGSKGSVDGHLVGSAGERIGVPTEAHAFDLCGLPWVDPIDRGRYAHMRNFT